ncbi:MAG: formate dehydrogenase, partial [Rhodospirillaceae bacterium]|nr:formate dehydrogenase [Rhodospirillaceae bacterium]
MSAVTVFVPKDAAAVSVGADDVAVALSQEAQNRGIDINLIRNGSRGLLWLEPLVEIETPSGRVAFG